MLARLVPGSGALFTCRKLPEGDVNNPTVSGRNDGLLRVQLSKSPFVNKKTQVLQNTVQISALPGEPETFVAKSDTRSQRLREAPQTCSNLWRSF